MIILALAAALAVQSFASFSGTFVDPQGAVLPGVRATLVNASRQSRYEVVSDRRGHFEFTGLAAGDYQFETALPGFEPYHAALPLTNQAESKTVTLQIGQLHETVTIVETNTPTPAPRGTTQAVAARPLPPCDAPPAATGAPPIGGNLRAPSKLRDVKPIFPAGWRGAGINAVVVLDAVIGVDGIVTEVASQDGADPLFADALASAVRQWQFEPTLLNCHPVEVKMMVTGSFKHQ